MDKIQSVHAREILDSRGNPTVEATVILAGGAVGTASAPSGASTGKFEAHELRDGDGKRFFGKGVLRAVDNVNEKISAELTGVKCDINTVDSLMIRLDGTDNKKKLGANAILAVSLAAAKAGAASHKLPLYRYLGGESASVLPVPLMNILNGGAHAANSLDFQEFMIVPLGFGTFSEALRAGAEIYHTLGALLKKEGHISCVGDEGGYAPNLSTTDEALDYIVRAIGDSGYSTEQIKIALDVASSEWVSGSSYILPKQNTVFDSDGLISELERLSQKYPIISVEDGLGEEDYGGWKKMTERLGEKIMLVGDDFFVTNPKRLAAGIRNRSANSVLVKPNQIGTLSETIDVVNMAKSYGYKTVISHRSGETADTSIADIAVALNAGFIKTGAPARAERCEKYNRLLKIEAELGASGKYAPKELLTPSRRHEKEEKHEEKIKNMLNKSDSY